MELRSTWMFVSGSKGQFLNLLTLRVNQQRRGITKGWREREKYVDHPEH
jgi:hypothetical protein